MLNNSNSNQYSVSGEGELMQRGPIEIMLSILDACTQEINYTNILYRTSATSATITKYLYLLVDNGYITINHELKDRRIKGLYSITSKGRNLLFHTEEIRNVLRKAQK